IPGRCSTGGPGWRTSLPLTYCALCLNHPTRSGTIFTTGDPAEALMDMDVARWCSWTLAITIGSTEEEWSNTTVTATPSCCTYSISRQQGGAGLRFWNCKFCSKLRRLRFPGRILAHGEVKI